MYSFKPFSIIGEKIEKIIIYCTILICSVIYAVEYFVACACGNGAMSTPISYLDQHLNALLPHIVLKLHIPEFKRRDAGFFFKEVNKIRCAVKARLIGDAFDGIIGSLQQFLCSFQADRQQVIIR